MSLYILYLALPHLMYIDTKKNSIIIRTIYLYASAIQYYNNMPVWA